MFYRMRVLFLRLHTPYC